MSNGWWVMSIGQPSNQLTKQLVSSPVSRISCYLLRVPCYLLRITYLSSLVAKLGNET